MGHVLLVSDNEVINGVYTINLKAYVAANVTIKGSAAEAIKLLDIGTDLDVIVAFKKIGKSNAAEVIINYLKDKKMTIPLVVVGSSDGLPNEVKVVKSQFDIKLLIRTVAKILEITAKDMLDVPVPEFFPMPTKLFANLEKANCDVYYKQNEKEKEKESQVEVGKGEFAGVEDVKSKGSEYLKIWEKGTKVKDSVQKLIDKGVLQLYIPASERLRFINSASEIVVQQLDKPNLTMEERVDAVEQGIELVANKIFDNNEVAKEEVMKVSTACVKSVHTIIDESPKLGKLLSQLLQNKTKYVYLHSVLAAYIASSIIENISWGGEGHAEKVSFVLFFHDIFLIPIFNKYETMMGEDDLVFNDKLTENEKEVVLNHARMAGEMVGTFKQIPIGADTIIKQHHGSTTGIGFAVNFKDDISPLAKVIILSEEFVQELLKHKFSKTRGHFNKDDCLARLRRKYTKHTYQKIIDAMEKIKL